MEVRQARYFAAVADEGHFGRAAARLHVAQSVVSQQVAKLERQCGFALFDRTTRRVELTDGGRALLVHARRLLAAAESADADAALVAAGRLGRVSVGFVGTATYDVLPRVAQRVRAERPRIDLDLRGELLAPELFEGVEEGRFDLAVLRGEAPEGARVAVSRLRRERLVVAVPEDHPLADADAIEPAALADEPFVTYPAHERSAMHDVVLSVCRDAGFRPPSVLEVQETATIVVFVAAGAGVALVPEPVRSLSVAGVRYVPLAEERYVDLRLATPAGPLAPAVAAVAEAVVAIASEGARGAAG
ncbi:LysR family transcriptional regulator [Nocardioides rotundus]|uniref:LysR substrate-binding domain-containing protein n=1 Tax=Nocardioides rotundus TaxID=1774216 RepID=UPI001CBB897B|nr:LysR substrate-binding domain-containing protein [Nocardioides rotundus]UAL29551.1 LysR family transcriptional regulator [Nocardioides rotundus]